MDLGHGAIPLGVGHQVPALLPAADLAGDEPVRSTEITQSAHVGVEQVELGDGVDEGQPQSTPHALQIAHRLREHASDDFAPTTFHHEEVRTSDRMVVGEEVGPRCLVEVLPQAGQHLELALHVVRAGGQRAERRAA